MENVQLFQGDCLDVMDKLIERKIKVDAIITDPPYGINLTPQRKTGKFKNTKVLNDDNLEWIDDFVDKSFLLTNNLTIVFCGWQTIDVVKKSLERKYIIKNILVWNKDWFGMGNNYRPNYELIILACKKNFTTKSNNKSNILTYRRLSPKKNAS